MIRDIEKMISENGPRWETPFFPPRSLFFLKTGLIKKGSSGSPVVFLAFDQRAAYPRWVVKSSRDPESASMLQKEYKHLLHFYQALSSDFRKTIPRPLLSREDNGRFLFIEGGLAGTPFPGTIDLEGRGRRRREAENRLDCAIGWLSQFQRETRQGEIKVDEKWIKKEVQSVITQYLLQYPAGRLEEDFFQELLEGWKSRSGLRLPLVGGHGRFSHENILLGNDTVSVFDWSFSERERFAYEDLLFFTSSFSARAQKGDWIDPMVSFEKTFFDSNWFSRKIRKSILDFFERWQLDPSAFHQIFPLFLIRRAIAENRDDYAHPLGRLIWKDRVSFYIHNRERIFWPKNSADDTVAGGVLDRAA